MTDTPQERFIASIDRRYAPLVLALDGAILAARLDLDTRFYCRMLAHAVSGDWRHLICAIDVRQACVTLRLPYGACLRDPARLLRRGASHRSNIDHASLEDVDGALVAAYVCEAVGRKEEFIARAGKGDQAS